MNWQQRFLQHQRKGNTLVASAKAAGVGPGVVQHHRRLHPVFDDAVRKLIEANDLAKPTAENQISVRTKKQPTKRDLKDFWDRWNDAAASGALVEEFGNGS